MWEFPSYLPIKTIKLIYSLIPCFWGICCDFDSLQCLSLSLYLSMKSISMHAPGSLEKYVKFSV